MQMRLAKAIENFQNLLSYSCEKATHSQAAFHNEIQAMRDQDL